MADEEEGVPMSDEEMGDDDSISIATESQSDESENEELFEVEQIVGMKKGSKGQTLYKVRWKGYSKANDTWEPIENLESCLDMIEEFEDKKKEEKKQRADERKKRMALMAGRQASVESTNSQDVPSPVSTPGPTSPVTLPSPILSGSTLKDTFWKDLEEGKINLFNTDMYSKVKGQGRASRPKSFKKLFSGRMSDETDENKMGETGSSQEETPAKTLSPNRSPEIVSSEKLLDKIKLKHRRKNIKVKKSRVKKLRHRKEKASSFCESDVSDTSSDNADVNMSRPISLPSSPSPPVLSCVEDYSDDSSRDLNDNRYSSPADITGEFCESSPARQMDSLPPSQSQGTLSEDTGIEMDVSPQSEEKNKPWLNENEKQKCEDSHGTEAEKKDETAEHGGLKKSNDATKSSSESKKVVTENSDKKSAKKPKLHTDALSSSHKGGKVEVDQNRSKNTPVSKWSGPKEAPCNVNLPPSVKAGKENLGDKHVSNILSGLSNVISGTSKSHFSSVGTASQAAEPRPEGLAPQGETLGRGHKRKDSLSSSDFSQPLEKILNTSSLLPILPDNKTPSDKGQADLLFDIDLEDIDLDELEKQLTLSPSAQPLELTDEELKQAVLEGDYELVRRALAARKVYDIEQTDDAGITLLMHAILRNYDDVAEVLVCSGAKINAQQKNGNTALMIAAERAHICTVALLIEMGARINLQQTAGETALMKGVKRGHKQIVRYLLENGANFSYLTYNGYSALSYAKLLRLGDIEDIIVDHISRLTAEFDRQVAVTLNNTANIISALFPLQCFPLADNDHFIINFKNEKEPITPGVGFLLFIAHARITSTEMKCRFYGPCAVKSVFLNGVKQPSLTEDANFVLSCQPVVPGKNELRINTETAGSSKAKLVVCAYKAQLIQ